MIRLIKLKILDTWRFCASGLSLLDGRGKYAYLRVSGDGRATVIKLTTNCQRLAKLKELQIGTQFNAIAAHLILPNHTQSPTTSRLFSL